MEEKILIKSELNKKAKWLMLGWGMALISIATTLFLLMLFVPGVPEHTGLRGWHSAPLVYAVFYEVKYFILLLVAFLLLGLGITGIIFLKKKNLSTKREDIVRGGVIIFIAISVTLILSMFLVFRYEYIEIENEKIALSELYDCPSVLVEKTSYSGSLEYLILFCIICSFVAIGILIFYLYWIRCKCSITITENNVKGKALFGKEVVLPIYMVSAYSTRKFLSTIAVTTASGITKFALIKNYVEIGNILSQKINERQANTVNTANVPVTSATSTTSDTANVSIDDLIKLKSLFDQGIITQEEFEIKKKQILGL